MAQETENQDSPNTGEEETSEDSNESTPQDGSDESSSESSQDTSAPSELESKNKKLFERAKKAETELKEAKERLKTLEESGESTEEASNDPLDSFLDNYSVVSGLKNEELQKLRSDARSLGVRLDVYMKSEAGKLRLEKLREEKKVEDTTPSSSDRTVTVGGKEKPISELSRKEKSQLAAQIGRENAKNLI